MPASPQSSGTAGSIVLVEEYGALAAAIGSALKKFAPGFATRTLRSLDDVQSAVAEAKPSLLVVDFDPPQQGALELFLRLKATMPAAGVLLIAAAPLSGAGGFGAFEFVEKPFDLTSLGSGAQAALGTGASGARTRRALRDLSLRDIIPLQCLAGATGVLKLDASEGRSGEVQFRDGQIIHAETTDVDGPEALREMLGWRSPRFKQPKRKPRATRSIEGNWATVLAEALARVVEESPANVQADEREERAPERIGGGKKVVVIDDTDMLLLFVEDSLASADPTLEIATAASGSEGVERVAAVKPDLVLLDYSLPDFNGDEVCRRLLANAATATIPIIMMSGHVPEMAASALRCENIVATIAKPFLSEALIDVVQKALADPTQFAVRPVPAAKAPVADEPPPKPEHSGHAVAPEPPAPAVEPPASVVAPPPLQAQPAAPLAAPRTPVAEPQPLAAPQRAIEHVAIAPPPPIPVMAPPPRPVVPRATATATAVAERPAIMIAPSRAPVALPIAAAPARIAAATTSAVVVGLPLEVLAVQFSPALQMAAIRARPASQTIALHVEAGTLPGMNLPEAGFELGPVKLDARGQIETIRLLPTAQRIGTLPVRNGFPVANVALLPTNGGKAVELTPAAAAPMLMMLSAPFELAGVELSPTFGVGALVLKARGGAIRVSLERDGGRSGATFQTAQVLLNRSAQIAEILLDAVA